MRIGTLLVSCALALATLSAHAFDRPFPPEAKRGVMTPDVYPAIIINDKPRTLSAGARIWNRDNRIEMPAALRGNEFIVHYTENRDGEIDRVWILTADEIALPPPKPAPVTTLPFPN